MTRFLQGRRYEFRIGYGRNREAWQRALDLKSAELDVSDAFYDDEWEQVVQAHGVTTRDEYLHVSRVGRGSRLNRRARAQAWRVFEEYRTQLAERGVKEVDDAYRDAAVLLQNDRGTLDYAAVIVDEAQDMGAQAYRLIRHIVPAGANDLFVVGDGHQRIYGRNKVVLGRCGIDVRGRSRGSTTGNRSSNPSSSPCHALAAPPGPRWTADEKEPHPECGQGAGRPFPLSWAAPAGPGRRAPQQSGAPWTMTRRFR